MPQATGCDLNLVVGQKHNATVGGDMEERIQGLRKSVAAVSQRLVAPKTWSGSEGVNVLQVLCDLLDLVQQMNAQLASHTHGPTPPLQLTPRSSLHIRPKLCFYLIGSALLLLRKKRDCEHLILIILSAKKLMLILDFKL